uniref:Uncharacterized protein n=1 Tax=Oryza nivara TaxID=4536 RepID=A0A0E0GH82_ORYNI
MPVQIGSVTALARKWRALTSERDERYISMHGDGGWSTDGWLHGQTSSYLQKLHAGSVAR